jgi:hypothetical protein
MPTNNDTNICDIDDANNSGLYRDKFIQRYNKCGSVQAGVDL